MLPLSTTVSQGGRSEAPVPRGFGPEQRKSLSRTRLSRETPVRLRPMQVLDVLALTQRAGLGLGEADQLASLVLEADLVWIKRRRAPCESPSVNSAVTRGIGSMRPRGFGVVKLAIGGIRALKIRHPECLFLSRTCRAPSSRRLLACGG